MRRRKDRRQAELLERWLASVARAFSGRILGIDAEIAEEWGRLNVPDPVPVIDGLIAATARVRDLVIVTRDVGLFRRTGARMFDPFAG